MEYVDYTGAAQDNPAAEILKRMRYDFGLTKQDVLGKYAALAHAYGADRRWLNAPDSVKILQVKNWMTFLPKAARFYLDNPNAPSLLNNVPLGFTPGIPVKDHTDELMQHFPGSAAVRYVYYRTFPAQENAAGEINRHRQGAVDTFGKTPKENYLYTYNGRP